jgi:hypothetical protein
MFNNLKIFSVYIFNTGACNIFIKCFNNYPVFCMQVYDAHNHPIFNKKISNFNVINERLNKYQRKFLKNK